MTLMYSGSQGSVGIKKVYNGSTYMPFMYNAYIGSCGSLGLIVDTEHPEMDRSWRGPYNGSYGSLGTQYALNG